MTGNDHGLACSRVCFRVARSHCVSNNVLELFAYFGNFVVIAISAAAPMPSALTFAAIPIALSRCLNMRNRSTDSEQCKCRDIAWLLCSIV